MARSWTISSRCSYNHCRARTSNCSTVSATAYLVPQFSHQGAALMLAHPSESKGLAGDLLVVEQGAAAAIHRAQRCEFRGVNAELAAEVAP